MNLTTDFLKTIIPYILLLVSISCSSGQDKTVLENEDPDSYKAPDGLEATDTKKLRSQQTYTPDQLAEDFRILIVTLEEAHPDLYRVTSRVDLDKRIYKIERQIKSSRSYLEFLKIIAPIFTDIGCIHTQWGHSKDFIDFRNENLRMLPLDLAIKNRRFFLKRNYSNNYNLNFGIEILEINGEKINQYLKKNYSLLPIDGKIKSIQHKWLETYFPKHHANFWDQPDTFKLLIREGDNLIYEERIAALLKNEFQDNWFKATINKRHLRFSTEDEIGYLTIESFNNSKIAAGGQNYNVFLDSCFNVLNKLEPLALIIDLRGIGWGDVANGAALFSYLTSAPFTYLETVKSNQKVDFSYPENIFEMPKVKLEKLIALCKKVQPKLACFRNDIYVIMDGSSVGAKGVFCARVKGRANTFLVGEESGGCTFGVNVNPLKLHLPNSKIQVFIPTVQMILDSENYKSTNGVKPAYPIQETNLTDSMISRVIEIINPAKTMLE